MFVQLWMTTDLVVAGKDTSVADAEILIAQHKIRRLPVVDDDNKLVGILSKEDIARALPSIIDPTKDESERVLSAQAKVAVFMSENPITATPTDPLERVVLSMRRCKVGGIPVIENDKLVGIITESDIFRAVNEILGGGEAGVRLELSVNKSREAIFEVMEVLNQHDLAVQTISLYKNFSEKQQLFTVRITGSETEAAIDALWKCGFKVNSVIDEDSEQGINSLNT